MSSDRSHPTRVLTRRAVRSVAAPGVRGDPILALQLSPLAGRPPVQRRLVRFTSLPRLDPIRCPSSTRDFPGVPSRADAAPPRAGRGDFGPATSHAGRDLICDLTSPIAVGSEPRDRLGPPEAGDIPDDRWTTYRWTVRRRADGCPIWRTVTADPEVRIAAAAPGRYLLEVAVLSGETPTGVRLSLDHDVELEPAALTAGLRGASAAVAQAMRELVTELRPYILEAAAATGDRGITARFLAAVMFVEALGRPKAVRERELDEVGALLGALARGDRVRHANGAVDRPLGVAQLRPAIAAMVTGAAPWIDQDPADGRPARDRIQAHHDALPLETRQRIFTQLRWPRSNIAMAARLLSALKNRPHRYPALTRAQLAVDRGAAAIVATEYAGGAITTPDADARPSSHGSWVLHQMQEPLLQRFFPDD